MLEAMLQMATRKTPQFANRGDIISKQDTTDHKSDNAVSSLFKMIDLYA